MCWEPYLCLGISRIKKTFIKLKADPERVVWLIIIFLHLHWMKYLLIIFSLYMTLLTLLPCQDNEDFEKSSTEVSSLRKSPKGIEHYVQESCPPFCTCACCSVSRHFAIAQDHMAVFSFNKVPYTAYRTPAISEQAIEIYQPPKVA